MSFSAGSSKGIKNDINVTPLVDVVLVLLIIFMVITPMLQRGKPVNLPKGTHPEAEEKDGDPLVLSITPDKKLWIEANEVAESSIEEKLSAEVAKSPSRKVLLKGDETVDVGAVRKLMDHAKKAGVKGVELGIEVPKK
jgi:biopolymer transport protein TolR